MAGPASRSVSHRFRLFAVGLLFFVCAFFLHLLHNDFPWTYHNDEPSKVRQVQEHTRNLRHPPLMLTMADSTIAFLGLNRSDPQTVVETARTLAAFYIAGTVVCVFLLIYYQSGRFFPAALLGGILVTIDNQVFEISHYFKEDAPLLLGIAFSILFLDLTLNLSKETRFGRFLFPALLGIGLAWTVGAKLIGAILVPVCFAVLLSFRTGRRVFPVALLLFLISGAIFSLPYSLDPGMAYEELHGEIERLKEGDHGMGLDTPHLYFFMLLSAHWSAMPVMAIALYYYAARRMTQTTGRHPGAAWGILLFMACFMAVLCFSARLSERYLGPVLVLLPVCLMAGAAVTAKFLRLAHPSEQAPPDGRPSALRFLFRRPAWLCLILFFITGSVHLFLFARMVDGFGKDSRTELITYINQHLPADAILAADDQAQIHSPQINGRKILREFFASELGTLRDLLDQGVTHIIITHDRSYRYFSIHNPPSMEEWKTLNHHSRFYQTIVNEGELLWKKRGRNPKPLHPGIYLYRIDEMDLGPYQGD